MTQTQLADELELHQATISKFVRGRRHPSMLMFSQMYQIFGPTFALEFLDALNRNGEVHR